MFLKMEKFSTFINLNNSNHPHSTTVLLKLIDIWCYLLNLYTACENILMKFQEPLRQGRDILMGNTAYRGQVKPFTSNKVIWVRTKHLRT